MRLSWKSSPWRATKCSRNRVSLQTRLSDDLPLIHGDRIQLQQVILNLIINGIEAMSGVSETRRELLVSTEREQTNRTVCLLQCEIRE